MLSLEDLSCSAKIIYGDLDIIGNLMNKYVHIRRKQGIQKFFKKQSVLIAFIYSPVISNLLYFANFPTQSENIVHGFVSSVSSKQFLYTVISIQNWNLRISPSCRQQCHNILWKATNFNFEDRKSSTKVEGFYKLKNWLKTLSRGKKYNAKGPGKVWENMFASNSASWVYHKTQAEYSGAGLHRLQVQRYLCRLQA